MARRLTGVSLALVAGLTLALAPPALAATPAERAVKAKLGGELQEIRAAHGRGRSARSVAPESSLVQVSAGGRVLVDVRVDGHADDAAPQLAALGLTVKAATDRGPFPVVEGWIDPALLGDLAQDGAVRGADVALGGIADVGAALTQGDAKHRGPQARALGPGPNGAGVKVGIISDSMNANPGTGLAASKASGDLPAGTSVILDDPTGEDEGRAMAEVIYDEAPGITQMLFSSGTAAGSAVKATSIDNLVAQGVKVIADDIFMPGEPFFQDGAVAQAVDRARAANVAYFASAGNRARESWEGTLNPDSSGYNIISPPSDTIQGITNVADKSDIGFAVQWDEPWGAAVTNLDVTLVDRATGLPLTGVVGGATDNTTGTRKPSEYVSWTNATGAPVDVGLRIRRVSSLGTPRLPFIKYIVTGRSTFTIVEAPTNSDAINPDAASAAGSLAVAAVPGASTTFVPETFSSRGPKTRLFDKDGVRLATPLVRSKPDLAAADCVATHVTSIRPAAPPTPATTNFSTFCGTSAAAPSAAGVAALIRSAKPSLSADGVAAIMTTPDNAQDCTLTAGQPDTDCGAGFIYADRAVGVALDTTPPSVVASVNPAAPNGLNGWYTTAPAISFAITDADSPIFAKSGCDPLNVAADGPATATCSARSAGGTTTVPVSVKRDTVPPTAPVFTGVAPVSYPANELPVIGCTSTDATSGLAGCTVAPVTLRQGPNTVSATATDQAGLRSTATTTIDVGPAIDRIKPRLRTILTLRKPTIRTLLTTGYKVRLTGLPEGKLTVKLKRGVRVVLTAAKVASRGAATVTLRAVGSQRTAVRKLRGKAVTLSVSFAATSGSTARSGLSRAFKKLG